MPIGCRGPPPSRAWLLLLAATSLLVPATTGCLGEGTEPPEGDDADRLPAAAERLRFEGCWELLGSWELSHDDVAPYIPPGFEHTAHLPAEDRTGVNATMDLIAITCPEPREATVLFPWLLVIPPDDLVDPDATAFRLTLPCIADASTAEVLRSWGAPCVTADARIERVTDTDVGATWAFDARSPDLSVRLEGTGAATGPLSDEPLFQQFHAVDGEVCATTLLELEDHIHWEGAAFELTVEGQAPFPVPDEPGGYGLLARPPFQMGIEQGTIPLDAPAAHAGCPVT